MENNRHLISVLLGWPESMIDELAAVLADPTVHPSKALMYQMSKIGNVVVPRDAPDPRRS